MDPNTLTLYEIRSMLDEHLYEWLDLYESAFPPYERGAVSGHLRALRSREEGLPATSRFWALLDSDCRFQGMAQTTFNADHHLAYLGYFAVVPAARGQGAGSAFYRLLLPAVMAAGPDFLLFDVERPDMQPSPAARLLAERRIRFYEHLGASLLPGVTLFWGEARQRFMFHPFAPLGEGDVRERVRALMASVGGDLRDDPD